MGSKNTCALEFACILGRNIKFSVNITIIKVVSLEYSSLLKFSLLFTSNTSFLTFKMAKTLNNLFNAFVYKL